MLEVFRLIVWLSSCAYVFNGRYFESRMTQPLGFARFVFSHTSSRMDLLFLTRSWYSTTCIVKSVCLPRKTRWILFGLFFFSMSSRCTYSRSVAVYCDPRKNSNYSADYQKDQKKWITSWIIVNSSALNFWQGAHTPLCCQIKLSLQRSSNWHQHWEIPRPRHFRYFECSRCRFSLLALLALWLANGVNHFFYSISECVKQRSFLLMVRCSPITTRVKKWCYVDFMLLWKSRCDAEIFSTAGTAGFPTAVTLASKECQYTAWKYILVLWFSLGTVLYYSCLFRLLTRLWRKLRRSERQGRPGRG